MSSFSVRSLRAYTHRLVYVLPLTLTLLVNLGLSDNHCVGTTIIILFTYSLARIEASVGHGLKEAASQQSRAFYNNGRRPSTCPPL